MTGVRISDLNIRLGQHYQYCHAIDDRHVVIFSEIRFVHDQDIQYIKAFPVVLYLATERRKKCAACGFAYANWVVYGDYMSVTNPAFYCDVCHDLFHKDAVGNRIKDDRIEKLNAHYRVLPYFHDEAGE
uniref:snRNA-activating protein complex subunit 3 n=2 Tax=Lotharella globosa TaxID=91324 RepID=A0A7S3YU85_9EUKA|mmetsp:Transcript_33659/g.65017  ORF Transcript_33659/g.65017 Transcript_33659/m.65017 type:complete len:129 (+) Transcript_33659:266-652(+)